MPELLQARIAASYVYPIKACGAAAVGELTINAASLPDGDREWAVIDAQDEVTWQGAHPRLACIRPMIEHGVIRVSMDGGQSVVAPADGRPRTVRMWNDSLRQVEAFTAFDAGDTLAALLEQATGAALRLVRFGPEAMARRGLNPLHLVSLASLEELMGHLGGRTVEALRFRPNLLLSAAQEPLPPFIEEHATRLHGEGWQMTATAPCVRCVVPGVDPRNGAVDETLPAAVAALSAQRFPGDPSKFGIYAVAPAGSRLKAGGRIDLELAF